MKKRDLQELQVKGVAELQKIYSEKKAEIGKLKLEMSTGKHKNVRVVKNARRNLRQIATFMANLPAVRLSSSALSSLPKGSPSKSGRQGKKEEERLVLSPSTGSG